MGGPAPPNGEETHSKVALDMEEEDKAIPFIPSQEPMLVAGASFEERAVSRMVSAETFATAHPPASALGVAEATRDDASEVLESTDDARNNAAASLDVEISNSPQRSNLERDEANASDKEETSSGKGSSVSVGAESEKRTALELGLIRMGKGLRIKSPAALGSDTSTVKGVSVKPPPSRIPISRRSSNQSAKDINLVKSPSASTESTSGMGEEVLMTPGTSEGGSGYVSEDEQEEKKTKERRLSSVSHSTEAFGQVA